MLEGCLKMSHAAISSPNPIVAQARYLACIKHIAVGESTSSLLIEISAKTDQLNDVKEG